MTTLSTLPVENILQIINRFQIKEIHTIQLVSRSFDALIKANESSVYRMAAIIHGYIPSASNPQSHFSTVREAVRWKKRDMERGSQAICFNSDMTWLEFCKSRFSIWPRLKTQADETRRVI
jgi:hypothetical protein